MSPEQLAGLFLNLVTPEHVVPQVLEATGRAPSAAAVLRVTGERAAA